MIPHPGEVIAERDGLRVIDCRSCGYAHLAKLPSDAALAEFYKSEFWQVDKAGALALLESRREWWDMTHADWLSRLELETLGRTLLDVGCGYGFFLSQAKARGWEIHGLELSTEAVAYCKAQGLTGIWQIGWKETFDLLSVEQEGIKPAESYRTVRKRFDVISALWLIEHLPDPLEFLRWCRWHLYSGGALLIVCPNEWTRAQTEANAVVVEENWWIDKNHINYFNMATLANLLGRAGFQAVEWLNTYPIDEFISMKMDYVNNPGLGPMIHSRIEKHEMESSTAFRLENAATRSRQGRGRDIVCITRVDV